MIELSLRTDFSRMERALQLAARDQVPFAASRALNDVARAARDKINGRMGETFDRPTDFTKRAVVAPRELAASKQHLAATVTVRPVQAKYLLHEEVGGTRTAAENTRRPGAAIVLPGRGLLLDTHGGVPRGTIAKLKKGLASAAENSRQARQAARSKWQQARSNAVPARDRGIFYVGRAGHFQLSGGFYQRLPGHRLSQKIGFAAASHYQPRFHYRDRVAQVARATWPDAFRRRLAEAIASAR